MTGKTNSADLILKAGLHATKHALKEIAVQVAFDPDVAFEERPYRGKRALRVDLGAEDTFFKYLRMYQNGRFANVTALGEERPASSRQGSEFSVLVDAVDGSDLLERDLSNWCTASVFFDRLQDPGHRILAAFVGFTVPSTRKKPTSTTCIYYATDGESGAYVKTSGEPLRPVAGHSARTSLRDASLCFYGQKLRRLRALASDRLADYISRIDLTDESFRIFNLGGNPMMVKLVDCRARNARWIDAVIEVGKGQQAHDVIPGAYIALKAGAWLGTPTGRTLGVRDLEDQLLGSGRIEYVVASTQDLGEEIVAHCKWSNMRPPRRRNTDARSQHEI